MYPTLPSLQLLLLHQQQPLLPQRLLLQLQDEK
jgi:hypothetical protein